MTSKHIQPPEHRSREAGDMLEFARFSRRPNRAAEIGWRPWSAAAFDEAARRDRPMFLNISTAWCESCEQMDEIVFSHDAIIPLLRDEFVSVRVDGDRMPHVQDRYVAGGWPTNAFLTPTGEVLWASTYTEPETLLGAAESVLAAWKERRQEFQLEVERRRRALEASRNRHIVSGLVRREAADDVLTATQDSFDERNGGFGVAPKFPSPRAIEMLYLYGQRDPAWIQIADRTLDGMIAGEIMDRADGGFFRYALAEDWTSPRFEKLLDVNAAMLGAFALGAHLRARRDWRDAAEQTVRWAEATLKRADGLWGGSQAPLAEFFRLDAEARRGKAQPPRDSTVYTSWNALWITALADAGGRLGRTDWIERARAALENLLSKMAAPDGLFFHFLSDDGAPEVPHLLSDSLYTGIACQTLAQVTGEAEWLDNARTIAHAVETAYWAEDGGFWDRGRSEHDLGVLRYRDRPFELNADAARFLLDLALVTGERKYRAMAERCLALLSARAGRYGVDGAAFAIAVDEFFTTPPRIVIAGRPSDTADLRAAALRLAIPGRRVLTVPSGTRIGPIRFQADRPAAFVCGARGCSPPVTDPAILPAAAGAVL